PVDPRLGARALLGGEHPLEEAFAEALQRALDAPDVDQVGPDPDDHATPLFDRAPAAQTRRRMSGAGYRGAADLGQSDQEAPMFDGAAGARARSRARRRPSRRRRRVSWYAAIIRLSGK